MVATGGQSPRELLTTLGVLDPEGRLSAVGALMFCPSDRTYIALSVLDVDGGELLAAPGTWRDAACWNRSSGSMTGWTP
jgi:hypothetical protein